MKEDLGMSANQLVTATSIWTVGYVIGQIPSNLLLTRIEPRWVISAVSHLNSTLNFPSSPCTLGKARTWLGNSHSWVLWCQVL